MGIDLAKQSFQLHGVDDSGKVALRKKLSRNKLSAFVAQLPLCLIGLEACGGAHHWVRVFKSFGHTVRMMAPQFVKPYVKSNKNEELVHLDERVDVLEKKLLRLSAQNEDCQRLLTIPGIGLLSATALVAAIGDISVFKNGRELSPEFSQGPSLGWRSRARACTTCKI